MGEDPQPWEGPAWYWPGLHREPGSLQSRPIWDFHTSIMEAAAQPFPMVDSQLAELSWLEHLRPSLVKLGR